MSRPLLQVSGLCMRFGGLLAVNGVALSVQAKQVVLPMLRPQPELKP
jgi:branched-chain amino acid transport system ATP-binding protein